MVNHWFMVCTPIKQKLRPRRNHAEPLRHALPPELKYGTGIMRLITHWRYWKSIKHGFKSALPVIEASKETWRAAAASRNGSL